MPRGGDSAGHALGDPACADHRFDQRIASEPIGAMQPRARGFAAGPKARHGAVAGRVHGDAAHMVVDRGPDRDELRYGIESGSAARRGNRGEADIEPRTQVAACVEKHLMAFG